MTEIEAMGCFNRAVEQRMEMEFGFCGHDYHLEFVSREKGSVYVEECMDGEERNVLVGEYESIEDLMENCILSGVPFKEAVVKLDYFFA